MKSAEIPLTINELIALFGFSPEALAANRAGSVTPPQRQDSLYRAAGMLVRGLGSLILNGILIAALRPRLNGQVESAAGGAVILLIALIAALWIASAIRAAHPRVSTCEGTVRRAGDARHPAIQVDHVILRISFRRWKHLPPVLPGAYRVYTTHGPRLLSLEPLPQTN